MASMATALLTRGLAWLLSKYIVLRPGTLRLLFAEGATAGPWDAVAGPSSLTSPPPPRTRARGGGSRSQAR